MRKQQFCVIELWRGIVNGVFGPFETHSGAATFAEKCRAENDNKETTFSTRVLNGDVE